MIAALTRNTIPLIVATALFMANLDATVLATSLPEIAKDLGLNPIHLKLALTSYLLALAVFIPASGWIADRYGPKTVAGQNTKTPTLPPQVRPQLASGNSYLQHGLC